MNWLTILVGIGMLVVGAALNLLVTMAYYKWKKQRQLPDEMHKEIRQLTKDMVTVRGQIKYIEGRMNGKFWRSEG